jgi:hypothetical protein
MTHLHRTPWILALLLMACAGPRATKTGFLEDYSRMKPFPGGGEALVWAAAPGVLAPYQLLLLDPVEFWVEPGSGGGLRTTDLERLEQTLVKAIVAEADEGLPLASAPGEGVLRLRVALTRIVPTRPLLNTATQLPPTRMISMATKLVTGTHLGVGHVAVEAEFSDAVTGEVLVQFSDVHVGSKFEMIDGMVTWAQVEDGLRDWAHNLQKHLGEVTRP